MRRAAPFRSRLGTFQDLVYVVGGSLEAFRIVCRIGYEATGVYELTSLAHRWQPVFYRKVRNSLKVTQENRAPNDNERAHTLLGRGLKCSLQIRIRTSNFREVKL